METNWYLLVRYEWNHLSTGPESPRQCLSLFKRMVWSTVSKAADKSKKMNRTVIWLSNDIRISLLTKVRAVSVECLFSIGRLEGFS